MWKWRFNRKPSVEAVAIRQLGERYEESSAMLGEQLTKLTRLQFKSGQDVLIKLDRLSEHLSDHVKEQAAITSLQAQSEQQQQLTERLQSELVRQLDDFDTLYAKLSGEESQVWKQLIEQWAVQLLDALAAAGVQEIPVRGTAFNSRWAESIGTISRGQLLRSGGGSIAIDNLELLVPYQIMEVVRRGFAMESGAVLRKALVLTLEEEKINVE